MAINHLLFFFFLSFFCYSDILLVHGAREVKDTIRSVELTSWQSACSSSNKGLVRGIPISHRYGPCSPFGLENPTASLGEVLLRDELRVRSLNSINKISMDDLGLGPKLTVSDGSVGAGNFVVTVGFGTPKRDLTLILDTGSELTWIQCKPCSSNCYDQQEPLFDPSASSTFSNASCTASSKCSYSITYHDRSYSTGYYARDTLTLSSSDVYPGLLFGCGLNNSDNFGKAAGILGLGSAEYSLISQTASSFSDVFCYCLPPTDSSNGYLLFGLEALQTCNTDKLVPLLSDPEKAGRYFVNLAGISIGSKRLDISSLMASPPGTIVDSATIITRLPPPVYSALRSEFQELMSQYPPAPPLPPLLDTCYNLEGYNNVTPPTMVLHFENQMDLSLGGSAVVTRENSSRVCLAFAGNDNEKELTIIGNQQHRAMNVLYNMQDGMLGFAAGGCGN